MSKVNFSKGKKITMVALVVMGVFNPASVAILEDYFRIVYTVLFLAGSAWVAFYLLKYVFTPEPVNVKPKGKKKTQAYIEDI